MNSLDELPPVLTVEEVAKVLRIGRSAAYDAIRAGAIPHLRLGRQIRVPRCKLAALLGEFESPNDARPPAGQPEGENTQTKGRARCTPMITSTQTAIPEP